jgi:nitrilase
METIRKAAADYKINVLLGFSENDGNSVYIAQCLINREGEIKMRRRKVKPTHMERTVFGDGSGNSLKNVVQVNGVGRVGALSCWEHTQPLLKYHTYLQREEIHVAAWPPLDPHPGGPALWSMSKEGEYNMWRVLSACNQPDHRLPESIANLCRRVGDFRASLHFSLHTKRD